MNLIRADFNDVNKFEPNIVFVTRRLHDLKLYYGESALLAAIATKRVKSSFNLMLLVHLENLVNTYGKELCRESLEIVCPVITSEVA